jgi:hypothetical protein
MLTANAHAARALLMEARELSDELPEPQLEGYAALFHGLTAMLDVEIEPARAHLEAARALHHAARHTRSRRSASPTRWQGGRRGARQLLEDTRKPG